MCLVSGEPTLVGRESFSFDGDSRQLPERIETFELQTTVIAEKFMQTGNPKNHQGFAVTALNSGTLASRAPHTRFQPLNSWRSVVSSLKNSTRGKTIRGKKRDLSKSNESPPTFCLAGLHFNNPGGFLLSHAVARAVPSAPRGLTSVFGMGTGVTLSTQPPENCF